MPDARHPGIVARLAARAAAWLAKGTQGDVLPGYILRDEATVTSSGSIEISPTPEGLLNLYVENLWVHTCLSMLGTAVAGAPWQLKRWNESTGQGDVVSDHPAIDLLERPYPGATYETLVQVAVQHLFLGGNGYQEKVRADSAIDREKPGPVLELRPLLPTKMRVFVSPTKGVEKYVYRPNLTDLDLDPDDVLHLKLQDPRSEVNGIGPARPAWLTTRLDHQSLRWNAGFFQRGATPGVILETPEKIPPAERTRIVSDFDEKFGGVDKSHRTACLPYGLKAVPFGQTMREMQFRELRRMTREEIMAAFRVPPILAGILDGASYANAFVQLQIFRDYVVLPLLRYVFAMLTASVLSEYEDGAGLYLEPDVSEMRLPDEEDRELARAVQLVTAQIISVDEARALLGIAQREETTPAPAPTSTPATEPEAPAAKSAPRLNGRAPLIAGHLARGDGRTWFARLSKNAPHLVAVERRRPSVVAVQRESRQPTTGTPARRAEFQKSGGEGDAATDDEGGRPVTPYRLAKARDRAEGKLAPKAEKLFQAYLDAQRERVVALLRRKLGVRKAGDDAAPSVDITEEELRDVLAEPLTRALQDVLRQGMQDGGRSEADAMRVDFGVPNEETVKYLEERTTNLEDVLKKDTARAVKDSLAAGHEAGDNPLELIERIAESGSFAQSRAQRIARTELHAATGAGAHAQQKASGVTQKQWLASPDAATREDHREMSGQVVDIDDPFLTPDGEELEYPGDPNGSAAQIVNCRCQSISIRETVTADDLADFLDSLGGDDEDAKDQVREAANALPDNVVARVDPASIDTMGVVRGRGNVVDYDPDEMVLRVGPKARRTDVQDGVKEHLVASVTTDVDARGFHNARSLSDLPDVKGGAGTERERAVALVSRAATGDRAGLEALVGRDLTNGEWTQYGVLARNFWAGFGTKGKKPVSRTPSKR